MILDHLALSERYQTLATGLNIGFDFLKRADLASLADGEHAIDGQRAFAIVTRGQGRGPQAAPLEFHRRFIDIQYVIAGIDVIGWQALQACSRPRTPYDAGRDIGFFDDSPPTWCHLEVGNFAIFFPTDAHAPLAGQGAVHKVVVKVAV